MKKSWGKSGRLLLLIAAITCLKASAVISFAFTDESLRAASSRAMLIQNDNSQSKISCADALKNAPAIKVGMRESEVLALLGEPGRREKNVWSYSFWDCSTAPRVGEQKIIGLGLVFQEGVVTKIEYATVDAIGPPPQPVKKNKKPSS